MDFQLLLYRPSVSQNQNDTRITVRLSTRYEGWLASLGEYKYLPTLLSVVGTVP